MSRAKIELTIKALQWAVGFVALIESSILAFDSKKVAALAHTGLPDWIRLLLAWSEIAAVVLFLVPRTLVLGAWSLLVVFLGAALIHVAHGQFNVGALLIYSTAVIVVMAHRGHQMPEAKAATLRE